MLIQKYNPDWVHDFAKIKQVLDHGLEGLKYQIEHIGSTSVPGLAAKAIIDIDIIYEKADDFEPLKSALVLLGYYHNGDQGIIAREVFKRGEGTEDKTLDAIAHHLYVCLNGSKGLERHLLSRDYLRKHEWARLKYQKMKYEIARQTGQNQKKYAELKELTVNTFIDDIIKKERSARF